MGKWGGRDDGFPEEDAEPGFEGVELGGCEAARGEGEGEGGDGLLL